MIPGVAVLRPPVGSRCMDPTCPMMTRGARYGASVTALGVRYGVTALRRALRHGVTVRYGVVWRDRHVLPSRNMPGAGRGKGKRAAALSPSLPSSDPGKDVVKRWRKRLCEKVDGEAIIADNVRALR